jgi:hypothetical protein
MHAAALEMVKPPYPAWPINHVLQEAFLVHVRVLAEFFRKGVAEFIPTQMPPDRAEDDILAVDFCSRVEWEPSPFERSTKLITAINKTLSHLTYSRDSIAVPFDAHLHAHGTLRLMRQTWEKFVSVIRSEYLSPNCREDIHYWLRKHAEADAKLGVLGDFDNRFDRLVREAKWHLNQVL